MPKVLVTAGTTVVSTEPCVLNSIFPRATFGTITVYDASGTALPGTADYAWACAALANANDAKEIQLPMATGLVVVVGASGNATIVYNTFGRGR